MKESQVAELSYSQVHAQVNFDSPHPTMIDPSLFEHENNIFRRLSSAITVPHRSFPISCKFSQGYL